MAQSVAPHAVEREFFVANTASQSQNEKASPRSVRHKKAALSPELKKRLQIVLDPETVLALGRIKADMGRSATSVDAIRDAIGFYEWVRQQIIDKGLDIGLVSDGELTTLVQLPFSFRRDLRSVDESSDRSSKD